MTPVAWLPHAQLTREEWQEYGTRLRHATNRTNWWLGDWIRFGQRHYEDHRYELAARITEYDYQTLRNIAWVAGRYEIPRRRENVSWSHHEAVASLEPVEQDRWLNNATARHMTVKRLRDEVRSARRSTSAIAPAKHEDHRDPPAASSAPIIVCPGCGATINIRPDQLIELTEATTRMARRQPGGHDPTPRLRHYRLPYRPMDPY